MSAYDDDPRVNWDGHFARVTAECGTWTVGTAAGRWCVWGDESKNRVCEFASFKDSADEAIRALIGDPR